MIHTKVHSAEGLTSYARVIEAMAELVFPSDWESRTANVVLEPITAEVSLVNPERQEVYHTVRL